MSHKIITSILILFSISFLQAQEVDLKVQLKGKKTFHEVMKVVNKYYEGKDDNWRGIKGNEPRLKHWKRWEWYMEGRLGPNKQFVDISKKLSQGKKQMEKMRPAEGRDINPYWSSIGPSTTTNGIGRADRIAFHPSDPDLFYVGTPAGGLWRTTTGGSSWSPLTDHIPSLGISGIVVNWADPNDLYILTGDGDSDLLGGLVDGFNYLRTSAGVLKSTDYGVTWKQTGILDTVPFMPFKLVQDPTNSNVLLAATDQGIYRTSNGGTSWTKTLNDDVYDVEFKPGTSRAYTTSLNAVYYSTNGGVDWDNSTLNVALSGAQRIEIEVTPANSNRVYLLVGGVDAAGSFDGVYRSTNSGVSYTQRANTPNILGRSGTGADAVIQSRYDHCMAVSSANSNVIITGAVKVWKSNDGGATFPNRKGGMHDDIHDLAYNPLDDKLYVCTDGGVYVSTDDGENWTALFTGFRTSQQYHMAGTLLDNNYLLSGYQDNGIKLRSAPGSTWNHVQVNDGFAVSFYPNDKTKFYGSINRQIFRYSNDGASSTGITPPGGLAGEDFAFFGHVAAHTNDPDYVFVGYNDVFVSDDQGDSWTNIGRAGTWSLGTSPSNGNRLYAAGRQGGGVGDGLGGLWRHDDITAKTSNGWVTLHNKPGFPDVNNISKITDVAVDPTNSFRVYVTIGGFDDGVKVFRSTDAGQNWSPYSGSLPNIPINCVAIEPGGAKVYIGTDLGVFYRSSGMNDWVPYLNGMPNVPVTDLFINTNQGRIYAATFGRGTWVSDLATNCPNNITLFGATIKGNYLYQANNQITSISKIGGGAGTSVHLQSGGHVVLNPGFRAQRHTKFSAYIQGCGTGGIPE